MAGFYEDKVVKVFCEVGDTIGTIDTYVPYRDSNHSPSQKDSDIHVLSVTSSSPAIFPGTFKSHCCRYTYIFHDNIHEINT